MTDHQILHNSPEFSPAEWLQANGRELAEAMAEGGHVPQDLRATPYVSTYERLVVKLTANGRSTIVKAFSPEHRSAKAAFYREAMVLTKLKESNLCPPFLHASAAGKWILQGFVDGPMLEDVINARNVVTRAWQLGVWYARYTDAIVDEGTDEKTSWRDYLLKYDVLDDRAMTAENKEILAGMPLSRRVVAKNDSNLRNFLVTDCDTLIGIDFERSALKPYGFDILVTGRVLVARFPQLMIPVTEALVNGFARGTDTLSQDDLLHLTRLFAGMTAFTLTSRARMLNNERLRRFNASADRPAAQIVQAPFATSEMTESDPKASDRLETFLWQALAEEESNGGTGRSTVQYAQDPAAADAHDRREDILCGICAGSCCKWGAANMAFLRPRTLRKTQVALGLSSYAETVEHYLALLPARHVAGSCFYHTETGCAIPREQRSDTCNNYSCVSLRRFRAALKKGENGAPILLFNSHEDVVRKAKLVSGETVVDISPERLG